MITAKGIFKTFHDGLTEHPVLRGIDLYVPRGQFLAIMGRSGAGKSTLLYQLGLLDHPTSGTIAIDGTETGALSSSERTVLRLNRLGYVFQDYALLPELTALENVALPILMQGSPQKAAYEKASSALRKIGLGERLGNIPSKLSGGEQQRVSIARAIAHNPVVLFADEPTASLDSENADIVMKIFSDLKLGGQTIVMVTHEPEYGSFADRIVTLNDGIILSDELARR